MSDPSSTPAKPGTACLGCRRRKLKCSRESEGCVNCTKADLPCVYPQPETGVKRKRGPYKKDKPARERHLEHLVKYLEPRNQDGGEDRKQDAPGLHSGLAVDGNGGPRGTHSEDLVKDALIALTKSSVSERESATETALYVRDDSDAILSGRTSIGQHPPAHRVFEYWQIFLTRVDPVTKVIHCPSFMKHLLKALDKPSELGAATEILCFSIYYVAVSTCTANEARRRFGESRSSILQRYGLIVENALSEYYGMPELEHLQAIILYMIAVRRQDDGSSMATLFGLAVRMAQMMKLHEDPDTSCSPFTAEYRRRAWYNILSLESRGAEEHAARSKTVIDRQNVKFPANLNDNDLDPRLKETPKPRAGKTDVSWVLMRWEIQQMIYKIASVRRKRTVEGQPYASDLFVPEQRHVLESAQSHIETTYVQYLNRSRPLDLMGLAHYDCILMKAKMMIDHPFGQTPTKEMSNHERFRILQSSVAIISITHMLAVDARVEDWHWLTRGYVQWHSLAIVVAELGRINNLDFSHSAWAVLDPILADWDRLYTVKQGEPAWDHVNNLIIRAKQSRRQTGMAEAVQRQPVLQHSAQHTSTMPLSVPTQQAVNHRLPPPYGSADPTYGAMPHYSANGTPQQQPTPRSSDDQALAQSWPAPPASVWDFGSDFGSFDGLDQIDFGAFDAVFGGDGWEFPSPLADITGVPGPMEQQPA